jgi:PD-(D/E)XK nuclease superfamily
MPTPSTDELKAAFCWEADDLIPRRPAMTAFRRQARYAQARWRDANHHPMGTQPIVPKSGDKKVRSVGSRLPLDYARETGANFLTAGALDAARSRTSYTEPRQSIDRQRLWADLLSSQALAFNLFGDLADDGALADRALHSWLPDVPGRVSEVRFLHSPGWFDPAYLNSLRSFDTLFVLDLVDGSRGLVAVDVRYHERNKSETPRPDNHARYIEAADRSGAFAPGAIDELIRRSDLCVMWITHLLLFSMLQHPTDNWTWGRYVVVHPAANPDVVDACDRYRAKLTDDTTFLTLTLEDLLDGHALPSPAITALRDRYLPG